MTVVSSLLRSGDEGTGCRGGDGGERLRASLGREANADHVANWLNGRSGEPSVTRGRFAPRLPGQWPNLSFAEIASFR